MDDHLSTLYSRTRTLVRKCQLFMSCEISLLLMQILVQMQLLQGAASQDCPLSQYDMIFNLHSIILKDPYLRVLHVLSCWSRCYEVWCLCEQCHFSVRISSPKETLTSMTEWIPANLIASDQTYRELLRGINANLSFSDSLCSAS